MFIQGTQILEGRTLTYPIPLNKFKREQRGMPVSFRILILSRKIQGNYSFSVNCSIVRLWGKYTYKRVIGPFSNGKVSSKYVGLPYLLASWMSSLWLLRWADYHWHWLDIFSFIFFVLGIGRNCCIRFLISFSFPFQSRPRVLNYTEQEIQQWREERKRNFPSKGNVEKVCTWAVAQ